MFSLIRDVNPNLSSMVRVKSGLSRYVAAHELRKVTRRNSDIGPHLPAILVPLVCR